jgi:Ca-activated chloride channel family protein
MSFIWPVMLVLLLFLPLVVGLYIRLFRQRQQAVARYGNLGLQPAGVHKPAISSSLRRHVPALFFLGALAILIVALARPQATVSLPRVVGTVMLAFDVSGSMAADDLKPTRMEAAKAAAQTFVEQQPRSVQIGVVAFSDSGVTVQAPTNDRDVILAAIKRLKPERGTSLANGILAALKTIAEGDRGPDTNFYSNLTPAPTPTPTAVPKGTYTSGMIVLLTDGENNVAPEPLEAAQLAADRGVRIYTVGIGSVTGADVKLQGFTVHTQLDEDLLKQISERSGGVYYNAGNEEDLRKIYNNINTQLVIKPEETEVTSIFAGAGMLVLLVGAMFSLLWFSRLP